MDDHSGGQSAGARSVGVLLLSDKQPVHALFHGAFMARCIFESLLRSSINSAQESGAPVTSPSVHEGQSDYDNLVVAASCTASSDTLDCLRRATFEALMTGVNKTADFFSYQSLALVWQPRVDGDIMMEDPLVSVSRGLYPKASCVVIHGCVKPMVSKDSCYDR
jgi:acetylcholinesterase